MKYPQEFINLIESFQKLPGIGKKTAERLAFHILMKLDGNYIDSFSKSLLEVKNNIKKCSICGFITTNDICDICKDNNRDKSCIIIVEEVKDVVVFEKTEDYKGLYHVLNGSIDFSKGISIDDLNFKTLFSRITDDTKEIIIATNSTVEGETTAKYIKMILKEIPIKITRLAYGLPVGLDIEYADVKTVLKSLQGRREY